MQRSGRARPPPSAARAILHPAESRCRARAGTSRRVPADDPPARASCRRVPAPAAPVGQRWAVCGQSCNFQTGVHPEGVGCDMRKNRAVGVGSVHGRPGTGDPLACTSLRARKPLKHGVCRSAAAAQLEKGAGGYPVWEPRQAGRQAGLARRLPWAHWSPSTSPSGGPWPAASTPSACPGSGSRGHTDQPSGWLQTAQRLLAPAALARQRRRPLPPAPSPCLSSSCHSPRERSGTTEHRPTGTREPPSLGYRAPLAAPPTAAHPTPSSWHASSSPLRSGSAWQRENSTCTGGRGRAGGGPCAQSQFGFSTHPSALCHPGVLQLSRGWEAFSSSHHHGICRAAAPCPPG